MRAYALRVFIWCAGLSLVLCSLALCLVGGDRILTWALHKPWPTAAERCREEVVDRLRIPLQEAVGRAAQARAEDDEALDQLETARADRLRRRSPG